MGAEVFFRSRQMDIQHRYTDAAIAHGLGTRSGDHRVCNEAAEQLSAIREELYGTCDRGEQVLTSLLAYPNPSVSLWAACDLLPINEVAAVGVLERIAAARGVVSLDARMLLQEWRKRRPDPCG